MEYNGYCKIDKVDTDKVHLLENSGLFFRLTDIFNILSIHANSLINGATKNLLEQFNALVCKYINGKRINYSQRWGYWCRSLFAVLQTNNINPVTAVNDHDKKVVPETSLILSKRRKAKLRKNAEYRRKRNMQKRKIIYKSGLDKHYGPAAQKPDMPIHIYKENEADHYKELQKAQKKRHETEKDTRGLAKREKWLKIRKKYLTASNFYIVASKRKNTKRAPTVKHILYFKISDKNPGINHGLVYEKEAIAELQKVFQRKRRNS